MISSILGIIPPAFILLAGAALLLLVRGSLRNLVAVAIPVLAFFFIHELPTTATYSIPFMDQSLQLLRVDTLSKVFGYVFTLSLAAAFLYGFYIKKPFEFVAGLLYVGCALGVVFAGDMLVLYVFWELMAVTSVILILLRNTEASFKSAYRYILVHFLGGLVLLAGIVLTFQVSGSIAFDAFKEVHLGTILILIGFLVNAAAIPFSSWLPDAYPEATVMGGVILSAYTSKTAVYTLLRGFIGWDVLIWVGVAMSVYGIVYALLENDMRRILAYSIINQVGFMVCAAGIGTPLAIAGACAHAFCHIIYKALLWMSAGAVLYRTGKSKCTDLGGLYQTMPWTFIFGTIGALAISSVPLTSGFTSKTMIILAAEYQHLFWPWFILEVASAGVFLHAGIKFPYFVFFAKDRGLRPKEAPFPMLLAMGFLAFLCIFLGVNPQPLYDVLPFASLVKAKMPVMFSDIYVTNFPKVVTQLQLLSVSALAFFLFLPMLKRTDTISIDFDIVYRKGLSAVSAMNAKVLESVLVMTDRLVKQSILQKLIVFCQNAIGYLLSFVAKLVVLFSGDTTKRATMVVETIRRQSLLNAFPVGFAAILVLLGYLFFQFN